MSCVAEKRVVLDGSHIGENRPAMDDLERMLRRFVHAQWTDNGIGPYEYWGARGVHHDWCVELEEARVQVQYTTDNEEIPVQCNGVYENGCDGEHKGPCRPCCREITAAWRARLVGVEWNEKGVLATYDIEADE